MNTQKLRIQVRLNLQKGKEEKFPIYIRFYIDSKKAEMATRHYVEARSWDAKMSSVKSTCREAVLINGYLDRVQNQIKEEFLSAQAFGKMITVNEIKNKLVGKEDVEEQMTILKAFDYHNKKMAETVKVGKVVSRTLTRYLITRNKLAKFIKYRYKTNDKPLTELRLSFITEMEHYLLTVDRLHSNTAHKYIKNVKKIMNMSVGLDWIPSNPFNQFKCSYSNPEREVLNQEEINRIIERDFEIDRLNEVRDVFIFCCYTGFAYADVYRFSKEAMIRGLDGNLWISTTRQKTGTKESVPLLPIALDIIRKYEDHSYCQRHNKLLPVNSNQRYNAYLKEIADLCGIKKKLTSHIARHTFATTITLANGVPLETVSKMLGHNKLSTTQIYAKVLNDKVSKDMELLQEKLFSVNIGQKKIGS